ncbi:hypothetical protein DNTS_014193 [Danionella cerebrum]|uniref:Neural cell adhesion molecule L1-like protein n=1 Tax=Danionella cerebrum TaxID=2873325 RepID=A0A553MYB6_9TELE|nr:hypothetical protein DNTS_014193 [Danionella translucida]TRY58157.1 hypothetical protein DNTS_014193 [Danionella translucida]
MRGHGSLSVRLLSAFFSTALALYIPPHIEQLPSIIAQTSGSFIGLLYDEAFTFKCEAKGNPNPTCYASNKLGTAISEEAEFIVPKLPKFPKEKPDPVVVIEGDSVVLECNPPSGIAPWQLYWMTEDLQHIEQNERVSMGLNGNLYFSNTLVSDSHDDYCCFASFFHIRTIVQKPSMVLEVKPINSTKEHGDVISERKPSILIPSSHATTYLKKGDELNLECIAEGLPTPEIEWIKMWGTLPERSQFKNFGKLLSIPDVREDDDGKYMCKAKNHLGEDVHQYQVVVEESPSWQEEPLKSQLGAIGSDIHIKCTARGKPQPTITWKRNGQPLDDFQSTQHKIFEDSVIILQAEEKDSAVYQCEASNKHGTLMANANVLVMNHPPLILTRNYLEYQTMLGRAVIMDCNVFSSPPAIHKWRREDPEGSVDGERYSVLKNGSLLIHKVLMEDMGQYKCLANNSEGAASITTELFIKDTTRIVDPPEDMKVRRGSMAELECQVECDPTLRRELDIVWLKDGINILSNFSDRYFTDDGILQILNVSHSDEGNYTCIVSTSLDQDSASAYITVLDVPEPPAELVLTDLQPRSVTLHWVVGSHHNSPITEFIIQYEENLWEPGKWKELLRVASSQASAPLTLYCHINYQFRVIAVNSLGRSRPSMPSERYKTLPCAPDKNPESIKIVGHLPHQMDISWEPLWPMEHNGPGLEYKLSYRLLGVEDSWKEQMVKRHSFVVRGTPTFVPYEVKIQAFNNHGWAPQPKVVTGYSGEDSGMRHCLDGDETVPLASPEDISLEVLNSTLLKVSWSPVSQTLLRGHLAGYTVQWWQTQSRLTSKGVPSERLSLSIPGSRTHTMVSGLKPFSEYIPDQPPVLRATNVQKDSITLVWSPPHEPNGILTGYLLQYQTINETLGELTSVRITGADTTRWLLQGLKEQSLYMFYLSACTRVGCGPAITEEGGTDPQAMLSTQVMGSQEWFVWTMCGVALLTLLALIGCFVLKNKGGKYAVKEKEEAPTDPESQATDEETPCEYSDSDEKPLNNIQELARDEDEESEDSSMISEDDDCEFNEDGSFIGEYSSYHHSEENGHMPRTS